ncbi:MBL fold metallo-hydrolase [Streptomyces longwoodensis]|uniref:MBL fold metallo-hydrolase n=2 Tax=Streptomyces longwoodensis TaxID=68231 RepID=UPI0033DFF14B
MMMGRVTIDRVLEHEMATRPPLQMFPRLDPAGWEAQRSRFMPDHWDPATDLLQSCVQTWVLRTSGETVLVDTGIGNDKSRPALPAFDGLRTDFLDRLRAVGVAPEDVTVVVNTHLHADHVGWNTRLDGDEWVPTFPNATYLVSRADYAFWHPDAASRPRIGNANDNVFTDSVLPIEHAGQLRLWGGSHQVTDGLQLELAPGHTPGSSVVTLESGADRAVFVGDLLHHPVQIYQPDVNSCFCEDPVTARASRKHLLAWAADHRALVFPAHLRGGLAAEVRRSADTFAIRNWGPTT